MHVQLAPGRKRGAQVRLRGPAGRTRTPVDLSAFFSGLEKKRRASGALDLCRHNMRCFYDGRPADKTVYPGAPEADGVQPELTRTEYLRLLTTARALDKERLYPLAEQPAAGRNVGKGVSDL